jgi:signal transduction histidine kinase
VHEPTPEQYSPPLTWRGHAWRVLASVLISGLVWVNPTASLQWHQARTLFWLDLGVGLASLVLSLFRRRWPLTVAMVTNLAGIVSLTSAGPGLLTTVSLATRRVVWQVVLVGATAMFAAMVFPMFEPRADDSAWWVDFGIGLAFTIACVASGMYLGSRRELLWTLRERAERAEAEQGLRVEQGQLQERARIAREMHDVLAHRISLITMHAGALAYRTDLTAEEMRDTAGIIQEKSHEALTDLRQVLGVLRSEESGVRERPQPTYGDLSALVKEAQESGMHIRYDDRVLDARRMPEQVGRTAYRIVQEGLTNARKHAPDVTVLVSLAGSERDGVDITIRNPARSLTASRGGPRTPGSGLGLVGLGERAKLAGGHLAARREGGTFELHGWLPWAAP